MIVVLVNCIFSTFFILILRQKKLFVSTNVSKEKRYGRSAILFFITFFTVQPLVNYKCENTASKVNTSNAYSCEI